MLNYQRVYIIIYIYLELTESAKEVQSRKEQDNAETHMRIV